jgi:hypothetical protein
MAAASDAWPASGAAWCAVAAAGARVAEGPEDVSRLTLMGAPSPGLAAADGPEVPGQDAGVGPCTVVSDQRLGWAAPPGRAASGRAVDAGAPGTGPCRRPATGSAPEDAGADTGVEVDAGERWATAAGAGATVSGRADGVTVADGATLASVRTGVGSGAAADGASGPPAADAGSAPPSATWSHAPDGPGSGAAFRWTGFMGSGADEVRLGVGLTRATTRPGGAADDDSWPSWGTIEGSPW